MFSDTSPDVITPSKLLRKISPVPNIPRRNSTARRQLASVLTEAANIEERRKKQRGSEVKEQRKRTKVNITNTSGVQSGITLKKKKSKEKESSNQETTENSDTNKCCECWENYFKTTKRKMTWSGVCVAETGCTSPALRTKTDASIAAERCCERKIARSRSKCTKFH
jgi:hypothetical protein